MAQVAPESGNRVSIYDLWSKNQKNYVLFACGAVAMLTSFSDTLYLPALKSVATSLHASNSDVSMTVSGYMAAVAVGQVIWASVSDYYGRLVVIYWGLIGYELLTVACVFAQSIEMLIAFRVIQGFVLGSTMVVAGAVVADVFAPHERGTAMGTFLTPCLVGPVIAPIIGGILSQTFGWRSTFVLLCIMTVPIGLVALVIPETLPHHVITRIYKGKYSEVPFVEVKQKKKTGEGEGESDSDKLRNDYVVEVVSLTPAEDNKDLEGGVEGRVSSEEATEVPVQLIELEGVDYSRPPMVMPWLCLGFLLDAQLAPVYFMNLNLFSAMFTSLTTLPLLLSVEPYNLSDSMVGFCFIPLGVGMLVGSILGGYASDKAAARFTQAIEGRLVYAIPCMLLVPTGCIGFGFTIGQGMPLWSVLFTQTLLCFGQTALFPTVMGYVTSAKPANAAAVSGVATFVAFLGASFWVGISTVVSDAIGVPYFYCILAGTTTVACCWVIYNIVTKSRLLDSGKPIISVGNVGDNVNV